MTRNTTTSADKLPTWRCPNLRARRRSPGAHSPKGRVRQPVGYASYNDGSAPLVVQKAANTKNWENKNDRKKKKKPTPDKRPRKGPQKTRTKLKRQVPEIQETPGQKNAPRKNAETEGRTAETGRKKTAKGTKNKKKQTKRHVRGGGRVTTRTNTCGGGDLGERAGDEVRVEEEVRGRDGEKQSGNANHRMVCISPAPEKERERERKREREREKREKKKRKKRERKREREREREKKKEIDVRKQQTNKGKQ